MNIIKNILVLFIVLSFYSCKKEFSQEELDYIKQVDTYRIHKDSLMEFSSTSPFNAKGKIDFHPLNYFDPAPEFVFQAELIKIENSDTLIIYGTKGEERKAIRIGFFPFKYDDIEYKLNAYKVYSKDGLESYMSWFTDKTTNDETYGVGRYLNLSLNLNSIKIYTIDFNLAFNPYCAYNSDYSCAIPTKEDYIDLKIKAGEKKFH